jgi:hypothetical protein
MPDSPTLRKSGTELPFDWMKDIASKLTDHLNKPVDCEPGVVYLLAGVRKLLERDDKIHSNGALWMYCHWALHVDLTRPSATRSFLERIDRFVTNNIAYLTPRGSWTVLEEHHLFREFVFLSTFRKQLRDFLAGYGMPTHICDVDERWYAFLEVYCGVIEDGTLSAKGDTTLTAVESVTFAKGETLSEHHHVSFTIRWDIRLKDGRTVRTNVETVPDGAGNMTIHGLQVHNGSFVPPSAALEQ